MLISEMQKTRTTDREKYEEKIKKQNILRFFKISLPESLLTMFIDRQFFCIERFERATLLNNGHFELNI